MICVKSRGRRKAGKKVKYYEVRLETVQYMQKRKKIKGSISRTHEVIQSYRSVI